MDDAIVDYSLTGASSRRAVEKGLAEADWYRCPIPRDTLRGLLERRDGPAIRDTVLWFLLIFVTGYVTYSEWGHGWALVTYALYCVLYASASDSRWHEAGHGTAFRTDWMNDALYEVASFMVKRESVVWRWSHVRHHSDTIIVGRDPEIAVPRPPDLVTVVASFFDLTVYPKYFRGMVRHCLGRMAEDEMAYVPAQEFPRVYLRARIYLAIYLANVLASLATQSWLPVLFVVLPNLFGSWLKVIYGLTQHAGLAENVLDHRLNCRTVYMNPVHRFLYWNMNYHLEHHMFPLVPYHALSKLHAAVKEDCPQPYAGLIETWREIGVALLRQTRDPTYHVERSLPKACSAYEAPSSRVPETPDADGWVDVCSATELARNEVIRFDYGQRTFALYRDAEGKLYATDGVCTHGNTHLAEGLLIGTTIECSKHNGRFNLADGSPARAPICRGLATYPVAEQAGRIRMSPAKPGGVGARNAKKIELRVVSNRNVATFIKELVLQPVESQENTSFTPGDYLQLEIPAFDQIRFADFQIPESFAPAWRDQRLFDLVARNPASGRRNNYSLASNAQLEPTLRFNVRIATPLPGRESVPGVGSSYVFNLKAGDRVSALGPFGDFHIKPTQREMLYIGGGAGMAPLRAHLSHLLETERCARKITFFYGARSAQDLFYQDYFRKLAEVHRNFNFVAALSAPLRTDSWSGPVGLIHEVVLKNYLRTHVNPAGVEYYLCGPPLMVDACRKMLHELDVPANQIAYDEF